MRGVWLGVLALVLAAGAQAAGSVHPRLAIRDTSPLTVRGADFQPRELVTLTAVYHGRHEKHVRASAAGTFTARFRFSIGGCKIYRVGAHGDQGSRALYRSPIVECGNPPAEN